MSENGAYGYGAIGGSDLFWADDFGETIGEVYREKPWKKLF